jgi:hypothetical protein
MNPMKFLQLAGVLALASLIHVSSATAQDEEMGKKEGILEPSKPLEVTSQHLAVLSRRLANAEALEDLDASIAAILQMKQDLIDERERWLVERERIANTLAAVEREIRDVNDEIDDIEDAIIASSIASAGMASPELIAIREGLIAKKNGLKAQRDRLTKDSSAADQTIAQIDDLLKDADRRLAEKQAEKRDLQKQIAKVSLTAPSEGARLLVDSDEELRISSDKPPKQVRIEIQKMVVVHGGISANNPVHDANDPVHGSWETIYDRTLEWKHLGSAGPGAVSLAFKTGVKPERRSIPIVGLEAFWLDRGEYRARVQRFGESEDNKGGEGAAAGGHNDWRSFSVVGKLDSEVFGKRAPVQAGGPKIKYGQKQIKPGAVLRPTGAKDEDEEDDSE